MWTWGCPAVCGPEHCGSTHKLAPLVYGALGQQAGPSPHGLPQSACNTSPSPHCGLCFLGDTSIRRYVRVTNLLQAGQLSQGSLTSRAEKADTLGECWQASALAAVGSWASRLLFLGAEQTLSQAYRGSGPGSATDQLCGLGHVALLFKPQLHNL